jgi:hypothetical protein
MSPAVALPPILLPANHKMVTVSVQYLVEDACDSAVTCTLSVRRNEPDSGTSGGDVPSDWEIIDGHRVRLRAERSPTGNGRLYTINVTCVDDAGNASVRTAFVAVPR